MSDWAQDPFARKTPGSGAIGGREVNERGKNMDKQSENCLVKSEVLSRVLRELLQKSGSSSRDAGTITDVFMRATLRGTGHHDVNSFPARLAWVHDGKANPRPHIQQVAKKGPVARFDGDGGLGELCCSYITGEAIRLAKRHGLGFCTIRHSNHFLAAAPYVEIAAESSCIGMIFTNTVPCMTGPDNHVNVIGNNPLGFGSPFVESCPIVLDIAMSYASWGKIDQRIMAHEPIPESWGRDREGRHTSDAAKVRDGGSLSPMAEHKGFGLALASEILAGALSDGDLADELTSTGGINSHCQSVLVIDPTAILQFQRFRQNVQRMIGLVKARDSKVHIPGEGASKSRAQCMEKGVALRQSLVDELNRWAVKLKVDPIEPAKEEHP